MFVRAGLRLFLSAGALFPLWLNSEPTHDVIPAGTKESPASATATQRKNAADMIKQLQENLARGKEDQNLAVQVPQFNPAEKTLNEKLLGIREATPVPSSQLGTFSKVTQKKLPFSTSIGACDP